MLKQIGHTNYLHYFLFLIYVHTFLVALLRKLTLALLYVRRISVVNQTHLTLKALKKRYRSLGLPVYSKLQARLIQL